MAVRPIDANWLKNNLNKVFNRECDELYGMMQLIDEAPTITPQNEPLTCEGCACEECSRDTYPCNCCSRNEETISDQYRPPEGEEE